MNKLLLIVQREFIAKVRNKSFIVMTFLSPLIFLGMSFLIGYLASINKDEATKIAVYDQGNVLKGSLKSNKETAYTDLSALPFNVAKDTASKSYEGLLFVPKTASVQDLKEKVEYISDESASAEFIFDIEEVVDSILTQDNLQANNLDIAKIEKAKVESSLKLSKYSGDVSLKGINEIKIGLGFLFGYLIMMFIIIYGNFVMRSVIEEKTNRIIEIVISSVKPFQLMMGKIIGNSLAGILQFAIWAIVGISIFLVATTFFGAETAASSMSKANPEAMKLAAQNSGFMTKLPLYLNEFRNLPIATIIISFIFYFIGGYFLYSSLYAAIGAAVDNETDSQQFLLPIIMPLMLGVYIGFFTVANDPHGNIATIFSMIPFTSPIVMLMRIPFGVPVWQIIVSLILLFGTFIAVVWFASKIYRVGILMYGKKPTWKELYKWLKY
ncbi:ABC transporter permease [Flavobacterium urocaniciphilum]|uniref:ABC-2 type transport system permease protein n=1 Tax=Flavobacterium urocaniciphilum TaxID=1299341 RepID=A0A1H8YWW1_9FLAO|nr:ABC transporter permease [Flavobacterium urocaniciphilum]SEP56557.1 ABC-2 type transport system permease protein [Flavobacterium urocaniciphilum]